MNILELLFKEVFVEGIVWLTGEIYDMQLNKQKQLTTKPVEYVYIDKLHMFYPF